MARFEKVLIGARFHVAGPDAQRPWWRDNPRPIADVLRAVDAAGLLLGRYWGRAGTKRLKRFDSLDELLETIPTWQHRIYMIGPDARGSRDGSVVQIVVETDTVVPSVVVADTDLEQRRATLLDAAEALLAAWHASLRGWAWLQSPAGVTTHPTYVPRVRPPRSAAVWETAALLDAVDARFEEEPGTRVSEAERVEIRKALAAPMPPGAGRVDHDGFVVFRWVDDLCDEAAVVRALDVRHGWIVEELAAPILPGWNEAGDQRVVLWASEARPPLVAYDPRLSVGYLPIVATHDGEVDEEMLGNAASWMRERQLPDGTPLAELRLIAPAREAAVVLRARSRPLGVPTVLYMTDDGSFWNPFPEGFDDA
jgi:hypothetical protein